MAAQDEKSHGAHLTGRSCRAALRRGLARWRKQHLLQISCRELYLKSADLRASRMIAASLEVWRFRQHCVQEVRAAVCRLLLATYQRMARLFLGVWRESTNRGVVVRVAHWRLAAKMQRGLQTRLINEWHRAHMFLNRVRHHTERKRWLRNQHLARNLLGAWRNVSTGMWRRKERIVRLQLRHIRHETSKCLIAWWRFSQSGRVLRLERHAVWCGQRDAVDKENADKENGGNAEDTKRKRSRSFSLENSDVESTSSNQNFDTGVYSSGDASRVPVGSVQFA